MGILGTTADKLPRSLIRQRGPYNALGEARQPRGANTFLRMQKPGQGRVFAGTTGQLLGLGFYFSFYAAVNGAASSASVVSYWAGFTVTNRVDTLAANTVLVDQYFTNGDSHDARTVLVVGVVPTESV